MFEYPKLTTLSFIISKSVILVLFPFGCMFISLSPTHIQASYI